MLSSETARNVSIAALLGVFTAGSAVIFFLRLPLEPISETYLTVQVILLMTLLGVVLPLPWRANIPSAQLAGIYLLVGGFAGLIGVELVRAGAGLNLLFYVAPFLLAAGVGHVVDTTVLSLAAGLLTTVLYAFGLLYALLTLVTTAEILVVLFVLLATPVFYGVARTLRMEATSATP